MSLKDLGIKGVTLSGAFAYDSPNPIDLRTIVEDITTRDGLITNNCVYAGMIVYVKSENKHYKCCPHPTEEDTFIWEEFNSSGSVQPDWAETDENSVAYIKNKPTIPTKTSDLTNDSQYITLADVPPVVLPTVDQSYNAGSANAQSGTAVSKAIDELNKAIQEEIDPLTDADIDNLWMGLPDTGETPIFSMTEGYIPVWNGATFENGIALDDIGSCKDAGTTVTVGGIAQTSWDADVKADKADLNNYVKNTDISTTPTANKIPKYNQFGQLIVNCTEAAPGSNGSTYTQYTGEAVPKALWRAYVDNFHSKIIGNKGDINTLAGDINTLASKLSSKKIVFNYYDGTGKAVLKKNCLYLVIDHSDGNDAHMYITDSSGVDRVATTQGDSAVESLPSFRLALIITTEDFHHTMVIGQTGKFSFTNLSPLYTKQVIWNNSNREMFIKTNGIGMSVWEIQV